MLDLAMITFSVLYLTTVMISFFILGIIYKYKRQKPFGKLLNVFLLVNFNLDTSYALCGYADSIRFDDHG